MIVFRKLLVLDTDPVELGRVKGILEKNGIRYEEKTGVSENAMSRSFNAAAAANTRMSYSTMSHQHYVYRLFVPLKDFKRAKSLI